MARADVDDSTPTPAAEKPQDPLYLPIDMAPEEIFRAIGKLRKDARDEIERLLTFLDETENHMQIDCEPEDEGDGDCELEDGAHGEPSLGSHEVREAGAVSYLHHYVSDGCDMLLRG